MKPAPETCGAVSFTSSTVTVTVRCEKLPSVEVARSVIEYTCWLSRSSTVAPSSVTTPVTGSIAKRSAGLNASE
ncbi:MAG: hypothetical protein R3E68_01740 [Burkholderiaceae bacterium]